MRKRTRAAIGALIILGLSSCVTQEHRLVWTPPATETPVSASAYYLTPDRELVGPEEYEIIDHFAFTLDAPGKVEGSTESEISADREIADLVDSSRASAVVNFEVYAQTHEPGNLAATIFTRIFGSMMLAFGSPFLFVDGLQEVGLYLAVPGAVSLGASYILPATDESRWIIGFEGDLVKPRGREAVE